jgi:hypothetical protein
MDLREWYVGVRPKEVPGIASQVVRFDIVELPEKDSSRRNIAAMAL